MAIQQADGIFDFDFTVGDICWTTTPYTYAALSELPGIELYGYQQTWEASLSNIRNWIPHITGPNPYLGLYSGVPKTKYKLPYFNEYHHGIQQNWDENRGPLGNAVKEVTDVVESATRAFLPAAGILFPKSWAGSSPASFTFTFTLINTNAGNGMGISDNVSNNKYFLETFIRDNLHAQNNSISISPPLIYEVYIPGIRWSPASVISSLNISNKGTLNNNINGIISGLASDYIFPDAWEVTVGITELINESRSLWDGALNGGPNSKISTRAFK